jgi:flagellar motility protein MotE (MotC chaperone)
MEFEKATEQKLSNIDRINEKIKKILNTLNEE